MIKYISGEFKIKGIQKKKRERECPLLKEDRKNIKR